MPGPVPQREETLARPRSRRGKDEVPVTTGEARPVRWPPVDPAWHKIAKDLYKACKVSGQADYYQQSDIVFLYSICDDLSSYKTATYLNGDTKRSPEMAKAIYSAMERLLVTEGDRRRVRLELHQPEPEQQSAAVLAIADYQKDLGVD